MKEIDDVIHKMKTIKYFDGFCNSQHNYAQPRLAMVSQFKTFVPTFHQDWKKTKQKITKLSSDDSTTVWQNIECFKTLRPLPFCTENKVLISKKKNVNAMISGLIIHL